MNTFSLNIDGIISIIRSFIDATSHALMSSWFLAIGGCWGERI